MSTQPTYHLFPRSHVGWQAGQMQTGGTLQRREGTQFRSSPRGGACTPGHLISKLHVFPTHLDAQVPGCLIGGISDLET